MMTWKKLERAAGHGPSAIAWYVLPRLVAVCVCVMLIGGIINVIANPLRQTGRIVEKTIDADNVIQNYEWFKLRHEDIAAIDRKIEMSAEVVKEFATSAGERSGWHRDDREEHARLSTIALGLKQQRADLVAEYNARSRMVNRTIFKAGDVELPERIEQD